ncbi:carbon monoxide dehydrogenase subunit G [Parageobacillus genomosp. 1]|jgi:carbon monoxide dehydrogenase subunit G|uniref:Carbon monoxide dehydrogenase subunit G n=1 Tax=Parageobacillus genomosp. 1 TaxID=1295642 RepID=A0ABC9VGJ6_9BACL|nr:carbon monoxide dehydrogenase subunit G [Parageobacillus genomosp. 1]EZP77523.1 carbon monoxide dehydrogenase subunit G [Parageobacillus genomosp. 1]
MLKYGGEYTIKLPREEVWNFITDPHKVVPCIPDLIESNIEGDNRFQAIVKVGLGPIRGKFKLDCELSPIEPGTAMAMPIKGGGMGSGVEMNANVKLSDTDNGTLLKWECEATISGPIASLGGRLIDNQAKKIIQQVFENLEKAFASV